MPRINLAESHDKVLLEDWIESCLLSFFVAIDEDVLAFNPCIISVLGGLDSSTEVYHYGTISLTPTSFSFSTYSP